MAATIEISVPDTLVKALGADPEELPRQTLEALIVQAYRKGQITHAQVGEILHLNRFETDGFLKDAQAFRARESEEFASDLELLRQRAEEEWADVLPSREVEQKVLDIIDQGDSSPR